MRCADENALRQNGKGKFIRQKQDLESLVREDTVPLLSFGQYSYLQRLVIEANSSGSSHNLTSVPS